MLTQRMARPLVAPRHMMQQTVDGRGGRDRGVEHFAPSGKAAVRDLNHRAALVARADELEEQIAPARHLRRAATDGREVLR